MNIKRVKNFSYITIVSIIVFSLIIGGILKIYTPRVNEYRDDFKSWINQEGDYQFDFTKLGARWSMAGPELIFFDPEIKNKFTQKTFFVAEEAFAEFGIIDFLLGRSLAIDQLRFSNIDLELLYSKNGGFVLQGINFDVFSSFFTNAPSEITSFNLTGENVRLDVKLLDLDQEIDFQIPLIEANIDAEEVKIDSVFNLPRILGESLLISASRRNDNTNTPSDWRLYLEGKSIDIQELIGLQGYKVDDFENGSIDIDVWMELNSKKLDRVTADLIISDLLLGKYSDEPIYIESRLEYSANQFGWLTVLDKFKFYTKDANWPESRIQIQAYKNDQAKVTTLDTNASIVVLENLRFFEDWIDEDSIDYINNINPRGLLREVNLNLSNLNELNSTYNFSALLDGVGINLKQNNTKVDGLNGLININQNGGRVNIDTTNLGVEVKNYLNSKLIFELALGEIIWRKGESGLTISTNQFNLKNSDFVSNSDIELSIPANKKTPYVDLDSNWSLNDITVLKRIIPKERMNPILYDWIQESMLAGEVESGKTKMIGLIEDFPFSKKEGIFQVDAKIKNLSLKYARDWPQTRVEEMEIMFERNQIYSHKNKLSSKGIQIQDTIIEIDDVFNPILKIEADSSSELTNLQEFMIASPIDVFFGHKLKNLILVGNADYEFNIDFPLRLNERENYNFVTRIKPKSAQVGLNLEIPVISDIDGVINISRREAYSENLRGSFLGSPISIILSKVTAIDSRMSSIINISGKTSIDSIEKYFNYDFNKIIDGNNFNYALDLHLPHYDVDEPNAFLVKIKTDLMGVKINLPYPLGKDITDIRKFDVNLLFPSEGNIETEGGLSSAVNWDLLFKKNIDNWEFDRGTVFFGEGEMESADSRGLHLRGNIDQLRFDDWFKLSNSYQGESSSKANFIRSIDLNMKNFELFGRLFSNQKVIADRGAESWIINLSGEDADGLINLPYRFDNEQSIVLDMNHLNIKAAHTDWEGNLLNPLDFPSISLLIKDFTYSEYSFGLLNGDFSRFDDGLRAVNLETQSKSFSFNTNAGWVIDESNNFKQHTYIDGELISTDTKETLTELGYQPIIASNDMNIEIDVKWPGGPREDFIEHMQGSINTRLGAGQLEEIEPGAGRIFGLLSIVALPRRLALDFRDVFNKGFGFDEISGSFNISDGKASTCNFNLTGPAADIGVIGNINLVAMEYDQTAIVSTNYGNTLPIVGAVVAGPPVAAALLLFSQVFKKPLQEMAQIYYDVLGTFEVPSINNSNAQNFALSSDRHGCIS